MTLDQVLAHASVNDQLVELGGKLHAMLDQEEQVSRWGLPGGQLTLHREDSGIRQLYAEVPVAPVRYQVLMSPTSVTTHLLMPIQAEVGPKPARGSKKSCACSLEEAVQKVESEVGLQAKRCNGTIDVEGNL